MSDRHYILKNKKAVKATLLEWAKWFETNNRIIKQDTLDSGILVSTVFLGLNHRFGEGKPLIFETMVFDDNDGGDHDMERYSTYEQALNGHKKMVKKWKAK